MQGRAIDRERQQRIRSIIHGVISALIGAAYLFIIVIGWISIKTGTFYVGVIHNGSAVMFVSCGIFFGIAGFSTN